MTDELDLSELSEQFREAEEFWEQLFLELLVPVEQLLMRLQQQRYLQLAQGQMVHGDQWSPVERVIARAAIGIGSRFLLNSLRSVRSNRDNRIRVKLRYTANYAGAFNKLRKLLPERIPQAWADQVQKLLEQQLRKFEDRLRAKGLLD